MERIRDFYEWATGEVVADVVYGLLGLTVAVAVIGLPIRQVAHHVDNNTCAAFGVVSGYEVKFVDFNFFSWDCLVLTADGTWVPKNSIRNIVEAAK